MFILKDGQKSFSNFMEFALFLESINSDVDLTKQTPNYCMFSKTKGIVGGCNFKHLCELIKDIFNIPLIPNGCIEAPYGYLITFENGFLEKLSKNFQDKTKQELLKMAEDKGLSVKQNMKKEDIILLLESTE